jgi:GNAT superfamily N-acetyltransferase
MGLTAGSWCSDVAAFGAVRPATKDDVPEILDLAESKREEYQRYQPSFWRKAGDSREKQAPYLVTLIESDRVIFRVHEAEGVVEGFIVASLTTAPPVYDPGGPVCLIDDFAVKDPADWAAIGRALLADVIAEARARGAILAVVVAGHLDEPKRAMLAGEGYGIASEWHTKNL